MVAALKTNSTIADNYNKLSLSSGYTVSVEAERVTKQAALNCAEKYFDDEEKHGLLILTAVMAEFSISSRAKKANAIVAEILRKGLCDPRSECLSRRPWDLMSNGNADAITTSLWGWPVGVALPIDY